METRSVITISLRTSCKITAVTKGEEIWNALLQSWEYALAGDKVSSQQQYERALQSAHRLEFDYVPAHRIAERPLEEVLTRVEAAKDTAAEQALLGLATPVLTRVSQCFDEYLACYPEAVLGKSDDQLRRFRNPRQKVIADFVSTVDDRPIDQITRADMLAYLNSLVAKVQAGTISPATANKNMTYFCRMIRGINRRNGLGLELPFQDLAIKEGRAKQRGTFWKAWILDLSRFSAAPRAR